MKGKKLLKCQRHLRYELQTQRIYTKMYYLKTLVSLTDLRIYFCTFLYDSHFVKNFLSALGFFFPATFFLFHPHSTTFNPLHFPQQKRLKISISKESPPFYYQPTPNSGGVREEALQWRQRRSSESDIVVWGGVALLFCSIFRYGFY